MASNLSYTLQYTLPAQKATCVVWNYVNEKDKWWISFSFLLLQRSFSRVRFKKKKLEELWKEWFRKKKENLDATENDHWPFRVQTIEELYFVQWTKVHIASQSDEANSFWKWKTYFFRFDKVFLIFLSPGPRCLQKWIKKFNFLDLFFFFLFTQQHSFSETKFTIIVFCFAFFLIFEASIDWVYWICFFWVVWFLQFQFSIFRVLRFLLVVWEKDSLLKVEDVGHEKRGDKFGFWISDTISQNRRPASWITFHFPFFCCKKLIFLLYLSWIESWFDCFLFLQIQTWHFFKLKKMIKKFGWNKKR